MLTTRGVHSEISYTVSDIPETPKNGLAFILTFV